MGEVWSFGRVFSAIGPAAGDAPALIHGSHVTSWADLDRRSASLAAAYLAAGARPGDRVAHLMRNGPAYLETTVAACRARMVHVNVNYRYTGEELRYILDNSDASVVAFDAEFAEVLEGLRPHLPDVRLWVQVGGEPAAFAKSHEALAARGLPAPDLDHAADDMLFIYTGGTTGLPKGVMWDQVALWTLLGGGATMYGGQPPATLDEHLANVRAGLGRARMLVMPPLMHGSGFLMALYTLARGGSVVTLPGRSFDAAEALAACEAHRPDWAVIVGDAFARPIARALDAGEGTLGGLQFMISSGTMWSPEVKAALIRHQPHLVCLDALGSSEGLGLGMSIANAAVQGPTRFMHDPDTLVVGENLRPLSPGCGVPGRIARGGLIPRGYWKDPEKTARTFLTIDGRRYSLPGDHALLEADGTITLLGRGSQCINTGGEKVFPEEVEEALKTHPSVEDALVVGLPDPAWGQAVTAVVELSAPAGEAELIAHVRTRLAAYKAPKRVVVVAQVPRAPNGKADYAAARALAAVPAHEAEPVA